jgi:hypothetical protein
MGVVSNCCARRGEAATNNITMKLKIPENGKLRIDDLETLFGASRRILSASIATAQDMDFRFMVL